MKRLSVALPLQVALLLFYQALSNFGKHLHFAVKIKGREKFTTQCYVQGEPRNERDGILRSIRDPKERASVIVPFVPIKESRIGELAARFDIVLGFTPAA